MAHETLLDSRVDEVLRTLPEAQSAEIRHHDKALRDSAVRIEFGILVQPLPLHYEPHKPSLIDSYLPRLVSWLAWQDLLLAERHDFPGLSPRRAMYLGKAATEAAQVVQVGAPSFEATEFMPITSAMVGLHGAILGTEGVMQTSDLAQHNLHSAIGALRDSFVAPLYEGRYKKDEW